MASEMVLPLVYSGVGAVTDDAVSVRDELGKISLDLEEGRSWPSLPSWALFLRFGGGGISYTQTSCLLEQ